MQKKSDQIEPFIILYPIPTRLIQMSYLTLKLSILVIFYLTINILP